MSYNLLKIDKNILKDYFDKDTPPRRGFQNVYYSLKIDALIRDGIKFTTVNQYYLSMAFIRYTLNSHVKGDYGYAIVDRDDVNNLELKNYVWGNQSENYLHNGANTLHQKIVDAHYQARISSLKNNYPNEKIDTHHKKDTFDNRSDKLEPLTFKMHMSINHNHNGTLIVNDPTSLQTLINLL